MYFVFFGYRAQGMSMTSADAKAELMLASETERKLAYWVVWSLGLFPLLVLLPQH